LYDTRPGVKLPCSMEEIETASPGHLARGQNFVSNQLTFFSQIRISGERIEYDKDACRHIIGIIIQTQNQRDALHGGARGSHRLRHPGEQGNSGREGSAIWTLPSCQNRQDSRHPRV
jgi:hypothetical protein